MLAPAVEHLLARGDHVYAVSRTGHGLPEHPGLVRLVVDLTDRASVRQRIEQLAGLDAALVYTPIVGAGGSALISTAVTGTVVELFTSRWAAPRADEQAPIDPSELPAVDRALLLGWTSPDGRSRWHTPAEISAAALDALDLRRSSVLGRIRPWTDRPV